MSRPVLSFCIFGSHGLCARWQLAIENLTKKGKGLELVVASCCNKSHFPTFPILQHYTGVGWGVSASPIENGQTG